jgi:hypothetical protein
MYLRLPVFYFDLYSPEVQSLILSFGGTWYHSPRINIMTGEYLQGDPVLPNTKLNDILEWLDKWRDDIMKAWNDCRDSIEPSKIPPLY